MNTPRRLNARLIPGSPHSYSPETINTPTRNPGSPHSPVLPRKISSSSPFFIHLTKFLVVMIPVLLFLRVNFDTISNNLDSMNVVTNVSSNVSTNVTAGEGTSDKKGINCSREKELDKPSFPCKFKQPYSSASIPLILMSMGRSGSSVTWDTLSTMLGSTTKASEITGGNRTKAQRFFEGINPKIGNDWPIQRLCNIQQWTMAKIDNPVITGFQWKPYLPTLSHPYGIGGVQAIAKFNDPPIKVLYLTRSPLDRIMSNIRHSGHQRTSTVPAHCAIGDTECIKRHQEHSKAIFFENKEELVGKIKHAMNNDKSALDLLSTNGVKHLSVSYEKLYHSNDVKEWVRIFDFLGKAPKNVGQNYSLALKREHIEDAFSMAPTSTKRYNETIGNYDEVKEVMDAAGLGYLLN